MDRHVAILLFTVAFALLEIILLIVALNILGKDDSRTKAQKLGKAFEIIIFPLIGPLFYFFDARRRKIGQRKSLF